MLSMHFQRLPKIKTYNAKWYEDDIPKLCASVNRSTIEFSWHDGNKNFVQLKNNKFYLIARFY